MLIQVADNIIFGFAILNKIIYKAIILLQLAVPFSNIFLKLENLIVDTFLWERYLILSRKVQIHEKRKLQSNSKEDAPPYKRPRKPPQNQIKTKQ